MATDATSKNQVKASSPMQRALDWVEWLGNKLPDPAALFLIALVIIWLFSVFLSSVQFTETDPRSIVRDAAGQVQSSKPIRVLNLLTPQTFVAFFSRMVKTFTEFPPLGVVLVAMLGVGVAEHTGFIQAVLRKLLHLTPARLLTPMVLLVAILSHTTGDAGYVLVIPLGGVIFAAAGRHPLAGIACTFAGVSGGFSANFLPTILDPLLQGFTQAAAQIIEPGRTVNPLCNWYFTSLSAVLIIAVGWFLTDVIIEPRAQRLAIDGDQASLPRMDNISARESTALLAAVGAMAVGLLLLWWAAAPPGSPFRSKTGSLTAHDAPLMESIVPLIFILFLIPGVVYGYMAGTVKNHRDIVAGMTKTMSTMGYYLVMAFAAAQFTYAFRESNIGSLVAIKGASFLKDISLPGGATIVGIIVLSAGIDVLIGSASAKWALLAPIFVPMLMQLGISPELTQAAYRIGDSAANIITPLLPYFPLIVAYCQRYVKRTGIGTLISLMLPYSVVFLVTWTLLLLLCWATGIPLGLQASYTYP